MTYSLPFGLKQKPLRKYFVGGSIHFSCIEGKLYGQITETFRMKSCMITYKKIKHDSFEITSKEILDKLLKVKTLSEIHALEVVQ